MFTYLRLKNYKSFIDTKIDFTDRKNMPKKNILIYGENGSGKSNIISAFYTLGETIKTMQVLDEFNNFMEESEKNDLGISEKDIIKILMRDRFYQIDKIIKNCKTVDSDENMILEFGLNIDNKKGRYLIETDNTKIVREELEFVLEKNKANYFYIDSQGKIDINKNIIENDYKNEIMDKIEKYWGKHSFLAILVKEINEKVDKYVESKISNNFYEVIKFITSITCNMKVGNRGEKGKYSVSNEMLTKLKSGVISLENRDKLEKCEDFLREFFTILYADIKDVYYIKQQNENEIKYKLYCKKMIGGKIKDIDFNLESTGTLKILDLVPVIIMAISGSTAIIDEFDSGIHDLMVKGLMEAINDSIEGQLIATTHNTSLMECCIKNDSLYFIVVNSNGYKEVVCLTEYDKRTHPNNNIRDLYLKGMYEGIPYIRNLDFKELVRLFN